ncbi:WAS/WASL-interacting protein family member 3-like [Phlebotomus argentipes]|uniref:WAS/WASL-interacting protein family member 3-like n=1 Tax=Phlebotomus argentipes TaxID=94469 RepID=UPI002893358E|nr:WAS/WASL-interacting protein family member 3-like [Phlebotomus argentipes]
MTPPEIMCPPPPPPPNHCPKAQTNGQTDTGRVDLLQAIRQGTTLKKTPMENLPCNQSGVNGTAEKVNGVTNGSFTEEPPKMIKGMDRVQEELCQHFIAKENGTLKKKPAAMQPIVKRLLTEKPTDSARKEDSERLMINHGKRNFVLPRKTNGMPEKTEEKPKKDDEIPVSDKPESLDIPDFAPDSKAPPKTPEKKITTLEVKIDKKPPVNLVPLQMPRKSPERTTSPDITKIIRTPTTPQSPSQFKLKMNHGKPNYTLPSRVKTAKSDSRTIPLEFLAVKLRETPNSPLLELQQVPPEAETPPTGDFPPFRSATMGRKRDNPPPSPLVPAAPTYDAPKYNQKLVVSFAMDLAATPNRYPDHVKAPPATECPAVSDEVAQLRQKKFTIDPSRLSVREV